MKRCVFVFLFFSVSSFLGASSPSLTPEYGVVKSRDQSVFFSCEKEEAGHRICGIYLKEGNHDPKLLGKKHSVKMLSENKESAVKRMERNGSGEGISVLAFLPITTTALVTYGFGGAKYAPLLALIPLDLVSWTVGLPVNGVYLLYKKIQECYLKEAFRVILGQSEKDSMRLSQKDMESLIHLFEYSFF